MFKLVVLCTFLSAVVAEPGLLAGPLAYSATVVAPGTTTITKQASSVVHPSPLLYSAPLAYTHFIKKRSAPFAYSSYIAPTTYVAGAPLATTYSAPLVQSASFLSAAPLATPYAYTTAHLIKKRSAAFALPATYIAPTTYTATAPLLTSTYTAAAPIISTPFISSPYSYAHLIKKRSAPLAVSTYVAPASYSSQSRIDLHGAPLVTSYASYSTPLSYASPIAYSHVI